MTPTKTRKVIADTAKTWLASRTGTALIWKRTATKNRTVLIAPVLRNTFTKKRALTFRAPLFYRPPAVSELTASSPIPIFYITARRNVWTGMWRPTKNQT